MVNVAQEQAETRKASPAGDTAPSPPPLQAMGILIEGHPVPAFNGVYKSTDRTQPAVSVRLPLLRFRTCEIDLLGATTCMICLACLTCWLLTACSLLSRSAHNLRGCFAAALSEQECHKSWPVLRNAAGKYCYREGISKEDHSAWHLRDNPHASNPHHLASIASAQGPL